MEPPEQAPSTSPPKRRHRLIVSVALVLLSAVSWWYWPRGDQRSVGTWVARVPNDKRDTNSGKVIGFLTLHRNGVGRFDSDYYRDYKTFSWRIDDEVLQIGHELPDWLDPVANWFHGATRSRFGRLVLISHASFKLQKNADGSWVLKYLNGAPVLPDPFVLSRPE